MLTILVVAWAFVHAPEARRRALGVAAAGVAIGGAFVLTDPASARYGLVTFHGLLWHGADIGTRLDVIVTDRIPDWLGEYPGYFVAIALAMLAIATLPAVRESLRRQPAPVIVLLGIAGGLVSQLLAGQWAPVEYFTPNVPAFARFARDDPRAGVGNPAGCAPTARRCDGRRRGRRARAQHHLPPERA